MGASCSNFLTHNNKNDCTAITISSYDRNFCTTDILIQGLPYNEEFCDSIGDHEFSIDLSQAAFQPCFYNDMSLRDRVTALGCCSVNCAIAGGSRNCNRIAYRGDPTQCCFRDLACASFNTAGAATACYDDNNEQRSCPAAYEDLSNTNCQGIINGLCSNTTNQPNSNWRVNWLSNQTVTTTVTPETSGGTQTQTLSYTVPNNSICLSALYRNLYGVTAFGCTGTAPPTTNTGIQVFPTSSGLVFGQALVQNLFTTYIASGGNIVASEDQVADTEMNDLLWGICSTIPGICTVSLTSFCSTVTTQDLINNPNYQKWCGCYMPDSEYATYVNLYNINKECTPQCNQRGIIPLVDETGIQIKQCGQSTCVIDNIAIDLYESKVGSEGNGSGLNFSQICGSCGSGSNTGTCQCTLAGLTFISAEATVAGLDLSQQCGAGSVCYQQSTDNLGNPVATVIPCSTEGTDTSTQNNINIIAAGQDSADRFRNTKILILVIVVIIVLIIIWFIFVPRGYIEKSVAYIPQSIANPDVVQQVKYPTPYAYIYTS